MSAPIKLKSSINHINYIVSIGLAFVALGLIIMWFKVTPEFKFEQRLAPEQNNLAKNLALQKVNIKGTFTSFKGSPSQTTVTWPNFRGHKYNNIVHQANHLKDMLDHSKLPILWSQTLGEGYAGAAIANGRVYVLDYDKDKKSDSLRCFSLNTGEEIWRRSYVIPIKRNHGISRTVPAVSKKYVVTIGPKCQVMCVDALTGEYKWGIDLPTKYDTDIPLWYTGQCPIIVDQTAIIAPGGSVLLIGVDLETGKVLWSTPNPDQYKMSHASPIPMTFYDKKMVVYPALGGMVGVSLTGNDQGQVLWQTKEWNHAVISPSPVKVGDHRLLVSAGYGGGSMMFKVEKSSNQFKITKLFEMSKDVFACEQHTPIFYKNHLYTILPNDAGEFHRQLVCMTVDGKIKWRSGSNHQFGLGPFIIADNKLFILDDNGTLTIAQASSERYQQLSQVKVLQGRESWAPIALAGHKMVLRDFERMICLDLKF